LTALNASNISSGTVPTARLGSGTASSSTFLRGDSTFQTVNTDLVSDTTPQLGGNLDVNSKAINFGDSNGSTTNLAQFGADTDLRIYHEDSVGNVINSYSSNAFKIFTNGNTEILTNNGETCAKFVKNGAVELYHDNSKKLETSSSGATLTGRLISDGLDVGDSESIRFGDGYDLSVYHDGSNAYVANTTGTLLLQSTATATIKGTTVQFENAAGTEVLLKAVQDGAVELYHNNVKKLDTGADRVNVTGHIFITDGSRLYISNGFGNGHANIRNEAANTAGNMVFNTRTAGGSDTSRAMFTTDGHFIPYANDTYDLGSSSQRWRNIYTNDLQLSNEGKTNDVDGTWGNYTIQEGENDLFLINNRSGKKYKFNLTEVS